MELLKVEIISGGMPSETLSAKGILSLGDKFLYDHLWSRGE